MLQVCLQAPPGTFPTSLDLWMYQRTEPDLVIDDNGLNEWFSLLKTQPVQQPGACEHWPLGNMQNRIIGSDHVSHLDFIFPARGLFQFRSLFRECAGKLMKPILPRIRGKLLLRRNESTDPLYATLCACPYKRGETGSGTGKQQLFFTKTLKARNRTRLKGINKRNIGSVGI